MGNGAADVQAETRALYKVVGLLVALEYLFGLSNGDAVAGIRNREGKPARCLRGG